MFGDLKKLGNKIAKFAQNVVDDKYERAAECLEYLAKKNDIQLCHKQTKQILTDPKVQALGIGRFDPINESYDHYCKSQLGNKGYVDCSSSLPEEVIAPVGEAIKQEL